MAVCLVGTLIGALLAVAAGKLIEAHLFGVTPSEPRLIFLSIVLFLATAMLALALPAWRASRIDPTEALPQG